MPSIDIKTPMSWMVALASQGIVVEGWVCRSYCVKSCLGRVCEKIKTTLGSFRALSVLAPSHRVHQRRLGCRQRPDVVLFLDRSNSFCGLGDIS
jgi:hypothetical protein